MKYIEKAVGLISRRCTKIGKVASSILAVSTFGIMKSMIKNIIFIVLTMIILGGAFWYANQQKATQEDGAGGESVGLHQGLGITDVVVGTGAEAVPGKRVTVHYIGTFEDGTKFDSSIDRGMPFSFNLGAGEVIKGWDVGVQGMKVGGKRELVISPQLGYGERGAGSVIPPNTTLYFTVELLGIE